jgi:hypothetical protein
MSNGDSGMLPGSSPEIWGPSAKRKWGPKF